MFKDFYVLLNVGNVLKFIIYENGLIWYRFGVEFLRYRVKWFFIWLLRLRLLLYVLCRVFGINVINDILFCVFDI